MNKVILMGRLTADPELRQTQSGISSCRFSIAVNRSFVNKQTGERETDFIRCTAWRQTAEFINRYFKKGNMICVEGELRQDNYQDKNHPDVMHYSYNVQVDNVEFTGEKIMNGGNNYNNNNGYNNNYGNNNYGNNNFSAPQGSYNAPPQNNYNDYTSQFNAPDNNSISYGQDADFVEIISDGDLPF